MLGEIVCITNTFPYHGEQFLKTELELKNDAIHIDLCTFMPPPTGAKPLIEKDSIKIHTYSEKELSSSAKTAAAVSGIKKLFGVGELSAAFRKKGKVRNVLKAFKFAYISELRIAQISDWIRSDYGNDPELTLYSYWMYEVAYVGARLKELFPKCRFVTRCHRFDLYESQHVNGYLPFRKFILDSADVVFPISNDAKNYLNKLYCDKYDKKMKISRIGSEKNFEKSKEKYTGSNVVVSCSNLIPVKRVDLIAKALKECKTDIEWYHFGDGSTRNEIEKLVSSMHGNIQIHLMGFTPNVEIQRFYSEHDITAFINVSESEGVPVSIMEAQSYGIPVIATDVGGTSEIVHDGENGVLLNKDFHSDELLDAIEKVKNNRASMSKNASSTWQNMSDAKKLTDEFYWNLTELEK